MKPIIIATGMALVMALGASAQRGGGARRMGGPPPAMSGPSFGQPQATVHSNSPRSMDRDVGRDRAADVGHKTGHSFGPPQANPHSNSPRSMDRDKGRDRAADVGRGHKNGLNKQHKKKHHLLGF